jgi:hypothetical protein
MNGLLFSRSSLIPSNKVLSFPSANTVRDYFGADSDEYAAALIYFQAYDNKFVSPRALYFARSIVGSLPGQLLGAKLTSSLDDLKLLTGGALTASVGSDSKSITGLSFASADSFSSIASIIEAAFEAAELDIKVEYSSVTGGFIVSSQAIGANHDISFDESPLATQLGLNAGAVSSPSVDGMSTDERMRLVLEETQNWVTFSYIYEVPEVSQILDMARWASQNYGYLFVPWELNANMVDQTADNDMASLIKDQDLDHVAAVYGEARHAVFIMGSIASIPWLRLNGTITLAFKRQSGLEATVSSEAQAVILESKNCNYQGNFATRNADFRFLYPGCLSASSYRFIDTYVNSIWLNARIQRTLMDGLAAAGRVPYTDRGYTMIRAWMMDPINAAVNNGAIEKGVTLNESQKSEVATEAGDDISDELSNYGYFLQVLDPGAEVRAERGTPIINLWYTYGGSVQKIDVASTAIL